MAGRVVFFLQRGGYEAAYQAVTLGITAVAMGDEVYFVFAFEALRTLLRGSFGRPETEKEKAESARAESLGLEAPLRLLQQARSLGARLLACETAVKISGVDAAEASKVLDELIGLASIWRLTEGARVVTL